MFCIAAVRWLHIYICMDLTTQEEDERGDTYMRRVDARNQHRRRTLYWIVQSVPDIGHPGNASLVVGG